MFVTWIYLDRSDTTNYLFLRSLNNMNEALVAFFFVISLGGMYYCQDRLIIFIFLYLNYLLNFEIQDADVCIFMFFVAISSF